jgi:hypothetical protein
MPTLAIDPYFGGPEAFTEAMWFETAANMKPSGDDIFNKRSGEASLVGIVPDIAIKSAIRYMVGYDQVHFAADPNSTAPGVYTLCRKNPIQHPYYDQLWCSGASVQEFKPDSTRPTTLKRLSGPTQSTDPPRLGFRTGYRWAKLLLRFAPTSLRFREDVGDARNPALSASRAEWLRNTSIDWDPRVETFETTNVYQFAEGSGLALPYTNPKGQPANANRAQIIIKPDVKMTWADVPDAYLLPLGIGAQMPTNILKALGTVNSAPFLDFPAGTLLFLGAKLDRYAWALRPSNTLVYNNIESRHQYNLELLFSYFNPPKGFTLPLPNPINTNLGHNNFPWPGNTTIGATTDPNGGKWFFATLNGNLDGSALFNSSDYTKIFDSPNNP